jgi:hypothetical protein
MMWRSINRLIGCVVLIMINEVVLDIWLHQRTHNNICAKFILLLRSNHNIETFLYFLYSPIFIIITWFFLFALMFLLFVLNRLLFLLNWLFLFLLNLYFWLHLYRCFFRHLYCCRRMMPLIVCSLEGRCSSSNSFSLWILEVIILVLRLVEFVQ